jgi:hypothetical protein
MWLRWAMLLRSGACEAGIGCGPEAKMRVRSLGSMQRSAGRNLSG